MPIEESNSRRLEAFRQRRADFEAAKGRLLDYTGPESADYRGDQSVLLDAGALMGLDQSIPPRPVVDPEKIDTDGIVTAPWVGLMRGSVELITDQFEGQFRTGAENIMQALFERQAGKHAVRLAMLVDEMVEPMRTVAIGRFYEERTVEQLAELVRVSPETVDFLLEAALSHLDAAFDAPVDTRGIQLRN
jgi:hypothetical protein